MNYKIKELAKLAHITTRTLRFYDEIDLLKPSSVGENGYRYYEEADLLKLQQILFFKELDFSLDQILEIMKSDDFDRLATLTKQKELLIQKKVRFENLILTIDQTMKQDKTKIQADNLFAGFTTEESKTYEKEVEQKWGDNKAYEQSREIAQKWTKEDIAKIQKEGSDITVTLISLLDKPIENEEVQECIEKYFLFMQHFYECSYTMFASLARLYVEDERFRKKYEAMNPKLPVFLRDAMEYFAASHKIIDIKY